MEEGQETHPFILTFQPPTLCRQLLGERIQGLEMTVFQGCIGERPQAFGRLQFGGVRRQEDQANPLRALQLRGGMPPRAIQDQHDLAGGAGPRIAGELSEHGLESGRVDAGYSPILTFPGLGADKGIHIQPGVAVFDGNRRGFAALGPSSREEGLQPDSVFVHPPDFDGSSSACKTRLSCCDHFWEDFF